MDRSVGGGRTEDAHTVASISNAFEVLRAARPLGQAPPKGGKQAGSKGGSKSAATHSIIDVEAVTCPISDEDLAAFPALSKQESVESRRARGVSYHDARTALHDKYQGFCAEFYNKEFEKLWHEFVAHQSPAAVAEANATATGTPSRAGGSGSGGGGQLQRLGLSAAVLSSRGIGGEADNIDMFGQLDLYLKARHSYTALLQPKDLTAGVNVALRTVLAQLRGPNQQDWGACDVEALHAWYADQTEGPIAKRTTAATAPEAAPSAAADADPDASPVRPAERRQTRRAATHAEKPARAGGGGGGDMFASARATNRTRPLVLLLQGADTCELAPLRDLLSLLSQDHAAFPCCLLLGVSTPPELLTQSLSGDMASRLRPTLFALPPQTQRLTAFFHDVVLGGSGGPAQQLPLALSSRAMATLLDRFAHTDGSIGALATGFDVAAMEHRMGGHLAALAGPAMRAARAEVASAAAGLPDDVVAACAQQFADTSPAARATRAATAEARAAAKAAAASAVGKGGKARGRGESGAPARGGGDGDDDEATGPLSASVGVLVEAVHEAGCAWAAWRLGLLWAHKVAEATGASTRPEFALHSLYAAAARPSFLAGPSSSQQGQRGQLGGGQRRAPGHVLIGQLTGQGSSVSVRALTCQEDGLRVLLDELLAIAQGASEEWPEVGMLRDVCRALQQLLDEEAAAEASQLRALAGGGREAAEEEVGEQEEAGTRGGAGGSSLNSGDVLGELVSPVRRALAGVGLKSPGTHTHTHGNALDELVSPVRRALAGVGLKSPGPSASAASGSAADAAADGTAGGSVGRFFPAIGGGSGNAGGKPPLPRGPNTVLTAAGKKAERKAAMLTAGRAGAGGSGADEGAAARAVTAAAAAAAAPRPAALSDRAGELLGSCLRTLLGACPFALPGSATFAYSDPVHSMEAALAFAPRAAVHEALLRPHTFLGGEEVPYGPRLEDAALAYRLLLGSDSLDVPHWFAEFCAANGVGRGGDGDGAGGSGDVEVDEALAGESNRCGGRRKGGRGRRTGMHAVVNSPNGKRGKRGGGAGGGDDAGGADCAAKVFSRLSDEQQEEAALTLAAYFSQAVSELTFVGMCRPSKRRKGAAVQRLYYPPETLI